MNDSFAHGPFLVTREGRLAPRDGARPPRLRFRWRGRVCEACWSGGELRLVSEAGRVPFTIEGGLARGAVLDALGQLPPELPEGWSLAVTPRSAVRLEASVPAPAATTVGLLRELVLFALALDPHLERLERAGAA